ncbi:unnamed protein product, partial [Meganyctiphanes norvegica]
MTSVAKRSRLSFVVSQIQDRAQCKPSGLKLHERPTHPRGGSCAKSAPSTPQTEQRVVLPRPLPRHDTFIAPGVPPAALPLPTHHTPPHGVAFHPMKLKTGTSFSKSNRHALKTLSRSTPAMSPSVSPRHSDSEGLPRVNKATKKFMRHFASDAPKTERVLNYYSCALVADILLQGTLYITPNYFAFYSKIFGHVSRLLIPIVQVSLVQKERTAKIIPNAVGLQTLDGKSYVFGSLLSRDSTYKLMNHCWKKAQKLADSDSEPPSQANVTKDNVVEDEEDDEEEDESVSNSAEEDDSLNDEPDAAPSTVVPAISTLWAPGGTTISNTSTIGSLTSQLSSTPTTTSPSSTCGGFKQPLVVASSPEVVKASLIRSSSDLNKNKLNTLKEEPGGGNINGSGVIDYITQGTLVKTCWRFGSIPVKLVSEGVGDLWSLPRTSLLLIISTFMLVLLFASAAFMLYRVDGLSQQMTLQKQPSDYDIMYEEVLQMQQRLHNAASVEIERTLTNQLKLISTVRKSLEAMTVLLNNEPAGSPAQIPDAT